MLWSDGMAFVQLPIMQPSQPKIVSTKGLEEHAGVVDLTGAAGSPPPLLARRGWCLVIRLSSEKMRSGVG